VPKVTLNLSETLTRAFAAYKAGKLSKAEKLCSSIIAVKRDAFDALHILAVVQSNMGRKDDALANFDRALAVQPKNAGLLYNRGITLQELKLYEEALASYERALRLQPNHAEALNNRGVILKELKRFEEALVSYNQALVARPGHVEAINNRGNVLKDLMRFEEALESYEQALRVAPDDTETLNNRGVALHALRRFDEAIASYQRALKVKPSYADALYNKGISLHELKRYEEALASYEQALTLRPDYCDALIVHGNTLQELKRYGEALSSYEQALSVQPDHVGVLNNRGNSQKELKRYEEALASYERALTIRPDYFDALNNRGTVLQELRCFEEALADYERALVARPDSAEVLYNRGGVLCELKRYDEALVSYDRAQTIMPDQKFLAGNRFSTKMFLCDWNNFTNECEYLVTAVQAGRPVVPPFTLLAIPSSVEDHLKCAQIFSAYKHPDSAERIWRGERYSHDRIRVAYISADFRDHPVAHLLAELFERHDRARFETIAISLGLDDQSEMRTRLKGVFERFIDVRNKSDAEVAGLMRELEVDIAVDLMGFTAGARPAILAFRAAPIQVNYLSYPGIVGTDFIDYILADRFVIPEEQRELFSEPVVYLPDTYLGYDTKRKISERIPARAELGLPETGFVFCAYNNSYKIMPAVFDIWMRLLRAIEDSVLWLTSTSAGTETNLRREAAARDIDPSRLIFASYMPRVEDHLARYRAADLFLDTLPFNAQTTACDALWVGLPMVTRLGETFVGRVAASVLSAVGLPELITHSAEEYEALALKLARNPALLGEIKAKLKRNRASYPLFDSARFTRHIEAAYTTMWERWQRGDAPKSFSVEPYSETTSSPFRNA
jgi:predicted O-linked N-acetylglucosamine transferase (SPINDLY family)